MQQQVLKSTAEVSILGKQETKIDKENLILTYQHDFTMPAEKDLVIARKNLTDKQALTEEAQELKIDAEKLLVDANEAKVSYEAITLLPKQVFVMDAEEAKIRKEIEIMSHRSNNEAAQLAVINNQRDKLAAEKDLLIEKKWTEQAQRLNTVNGLTVTGVIGRQNSLYEAQTAGFHRDAEQKLTKILADTWNVRRSTADDTPANNTNRLDDSNIGAVIEKAMQGISVTPPP